MISDFLGQRIYVCQPRTSQLGIFSADDGKRFTCQSCGKSYKWLKSLVQHERIECLKLPQLSCEICGQLFKHKHHLKRHKFRLHQNII